VDAPDLAAARVAGTAPVKRRLLAKEESEWTPVASVRCRL